MSRRRREEKKKRDEAGSKKAESPKLVRPRLDEMNRERDKLFLEIAKSLPAGDEEAVQRKAEELAGELTRSMYRDIADNIQRQKKAGAGFQEVKDEDIARLAEEAKPDPEGYREAVEGIKSKIRQAMAQVGKEAFDPNLFIAQWPMWTIVDEKIYHEQGLPFALVTLGTELGKTFPVFTDNDGARLLIEEMPLPGKVPLKIITPKALRVFLTDFSRVDGKFVVFDLRKLRGRFYPVKDILAAIPSDPDEGSPDPPKNG